MNREQFYKDFSDQYRQKTKFMLDLEINSKQKTHLFEILDAIPDDIIQGFSWVMIKPNNFLPTIKTNICEIEIRKESILTTFKVIGDTLKPKITSWVLHTHHRKDISTYGKAILKTYYETLLRNL